MCPLKGAFKGSHIKELNMLQGYHDSDKDFLGQPSVSKLLAVPLLHLPSGGSRPQRSRNPKPEALHGLGMETGVPNPCDWLRQEQSCAAMCSDDWGQEFTSG